jgi:hypothetical protein
MQTSKVGDFSVLRLRKNLNWRAIRMNGQGMNLLKFRTWVSVNRAAAVLFCLLPSLLLADQAALDGTSLTLPQVGEHGLRILDPGTLELLRINGMPPGGPVDSWNFDVTEGVFTTPPLTEFNVTVDGQAVAVTGSGFRRRAVSVPPQVRDLRVESRLFLRLAAPVPDGAAVVVTNPGATLWPASFSFAITASPLRLSQAIHVNQEGYTTSLPKQVMVGYNLGSLGELPLNPALGFSLVESGSGNTVFSGPLTRRPDVGFTMAPLPYQEVLQADFSAWQTPGEYRLKVPGLGASLPFLIADGMAMNFTRAYALGIYQQRSGAPVGLPFSRHSHAASHLAPAQVPVPAASFVKPWQNIASANGNYNLNPRHTAPRLATEADQLFPFINPGPVDVSGGHYDAGDYSKYTINSAQMLHYLTFAVDSMPGVAALDNLGLPESGDGISDVLQEAMHEAAFLSKMQDADGGFYFLVYPRERKYEDNVLPDQGDPQIVYPKNTSATAAATAALAELASSPTFQSLYPALAASYLQKANLGWQFLMNAIAIYGKDGCYQKITHYGDVFMHDDELAWAACAIFLATGDANAHSLLRTWFDPSDRNTRRWTWWRLFEAYGCATRSYAFAVSSGRRTAGEMDAAYLTKCRNEVQAAGDYALTNSLNSAYGTAFDSASKRTRSAGWYFSSERAFDISAARALMDKPGYLAGIMTNLNYEAGGNPVNICYITGIGQRRQHEIVNQYAKNDRRGLPPSGIPQGNLQTGIPWLNLYGTEPASLTFPRDSADTSPYAFYDRWTDTFNTSTEAVTVDATRSLVSLAMVAAGTPTAAQAWHSSPAAIIIPPGDVTVGTPVTAVLSAPAVDLSQARIVWESGDVSPACGGTEWTFTPTSVGLQWIEVEAALPDGRRVAAATSFATKVVTGHYPWVSDSNTLALYHFDGNWQDSSSRGFHLTAAGAVANATDNRGWMAYPAGGTARFTAFGQNLSVAIPDSLIMPGSVRPDLTIEARIYPRAWKAYGVGNCPVVSLRQEWDNSLELRDGKWNSPAAPVAAAGNVIATSAAAWSRACTLNTWHLLKLTLSSSGSIQCRLDGNLVGTANAASFSGIRTNAWIFTMGNFDGDLDEVRVSNVVR